MLSTVSFNTYAKQMKLLSEMLDLFEALRGQGSHLHWTALLLSLRGFPFCSSLSSLTWACISPRKLLTIDLCLKGLCLGGLRTPVSSKGNSAQLP